MQGTETIALCSLKPGDQFDLGGRNPPFEVCDWVPRDATVWAINVARYRATGECIPSPFSAHVRVNEMNVRRRVSECAKAPKGGAS